MALGLLFIIQPFVLFFFAKKKNLNPSTSDCEVTHIIIIIIRAVKSSVFRIRNDCQVLFYTYKEFVLMMLEHDSLVKTKLFKNKKIQQYKCTYTVCFTVGSDTVNKEVRAER